LMFVESQMVHI